MGLLGDNIYTTESAGLTWSQSNARLPLLSGMESEILSAKVDISPCISRNKPTTSRPPSQFLLLVGQYIHTVNQKGWASRTPQQWEIPALKFYRRRLFTSKENRVSSKASWGPVTTSRTRSPRGHKLLASFLIYLSLLLTPLGEAGGW